MVEPHDYIVPLLHLLIGLVNKVWTSLLQFLYEFVENVSEAEVVLKDSIVDLNKELHYCK